jgi:hypothetical protein
MNPSNSRPWRWAAACGVPLVFVGLTVWLLAPLSTSLRSHLFDARSFVGFYLNRPDIELHAWILAWGTHALAHGNLAGFFDANIFHPVPQTLVLSEHMLGSQPFFAPLYLSTQNLALALNLWVLSTFVLSGLAMYWVTLRWFESHAAAMVASAAYAFAPWRFAELSHVQMLSVQYLPLLAYAVWRTAERRDATLWLAICGLTAIQALSCYYLAYMGFLLVAVVAGVQVVLVRPARRARLVYVGSALLVAVLIMMPCTLPYLELRSVGGYGVKMDPPQYWPVIRNYLFPLFPPGSDGAWAAWLALPWVALLGLVLGAVTRTYRRLTIALGVLGLLSATIAVGGKIWIGETQIFDLDRLLSALVPGWSGIRVYNRFAVLTWLAMSLLAALPFVRRHWRESARVRVTRGLAAAGVTAALLYSAAALDVHIRPSPEAATNTDAYRWLAMHGEGDPLLEWPAGFAWDESAYVYLSTLHWLPLVNGYSGYRPSPSRMILELARSLPERRATRTLIELNVARWLLVHEDNARFGTRDWTKLEEAGARLRFQNGALRLYELPYDHTRVPRQVLEANSETSVLGTPKATLLPTDLEASVRSLRTTVADPRVGVGVSIPLWVRNDSSVTWPSVGTDENGLVGLTFRGRDQSDNDGESTCEGFTRLPADLEPGQDAVVWALCHGPQTAGIYELVPCLTQWGRGTTRCVDGPQSRVQLEAMPHRRN